MRGLYAGSGVCVVGVRDGGGLSKREVSRRSCKRRYGIKIADNGGKVRETNKNERTPPACLGPAANSNSEESNLNVNERDRSSHLNRVVARGCRGIHH